MSEGGFGGRCGGMGGKVSIPPSLSPLFLRNKALETQPFVPNVGAAIYTRLIRFRISREQVPLSWASLFFVEEAN